MWVFVQATGDFLKPDGRRLTVGYSGHWDGSPPAGGPNDHRNKPADQSLSDLGPIPAGRYTIGPAHDDPHGKGPIVMALTPDAANRMFGRSAFLIHGDRAPPRSGTASNGCIILDHDSRQSIAASADRVLEVVAVAALAGARSFALPVALGKTARKAKKKAASPRRKTTKSASKRRPVKKPAKARKSGATRAPAGKSSAAKKTAPKKRSGRRSGRTR
jgi:type VI secretion system (T6SS) effector TldE1-like protein